MKKMEDMTEPELSELLTAMALSVENAARLRNVERPLFALVVFNDPKLGQYVSNASRETVVEALREAADRLEKREDVERESN